MRAKCLITGPKALAKMASDEKSVNTNKNGLCERIVAGDYRAHCCVFFPSLC